MSDPQTACSIVDGLAIFKELAVAVAAIGTVTIAYMGLSSWKSELSGKSSFDAARSLAKATYRLRDELAMCRSPLISGYEFPEGYSNVFGRHKKEEDGDAWRHVYANRWKPVAEAVRDFDAAALEAEALWGQSIKQKTDVLIACVHDLSIAIDALIANYYSGGEDFKDRAFAKNIRSKVSAGRSAQDPLTNKISESIKALEAEVRPHLDSQR